MRIEEISFAEIEKRIIDNEIKDVHLTTAMRIFKVKAEDVTPEMRRYAKVVNSSVLYGISSI